MKLRHIPSFLHQVAKCLRSPMWCVMSYRDTNGGRNVLTSFRVVSSWPSFVTAAGIVSESMEDSIMQEIALEQARTILEKAAHA